MILWAVVIGVVIILSILLVRIMLPSMTGGRVGNYVLLLIGFGLTIVGILVT
jgi:hypothetical protein